MALENDLEKVHTCTIPKSYYVPDGGVKHLSPQHWAQNKMISNLNPVQLKSQIMCHVRCYGNRANIKETLWSINKKYCNILVSPWLQEIWGIRGSCRLSWSIRQSRLHIWRGTCNRRRWNIILQTQKMPWKGKPLHTHPRNTNIDISTEIPTPPQ